MEIDAGVEGGPSASAAKAPVGSEGYTTVGNKPFVHPPGSAADEARKQQKLDQAMADEINDTRQERAATAEKRKKIGVNCKIMKIFRNYLSEKWYHQNHFDT